MFSPQSMSVVLQASLLLTEVLLAQAPTLPPDLWREAGLPAIQNYRSGDYQAGPNNHAIAQDERGLLYFANDEGVLVFDGVRWQLIRTPEQATVRALCHVNGRIYVGAQDDLGYLAPDASGQLQFVSLKPHVPEEHRDFKGIWEVVAIADTVFFRSYYAVFRWADGRLTAWKPQRLFHNAYAAGGSFYVREHAVGLQRLTGDSLQLFPGGEELANETFAGLWSGEDGRLWGVTRFQGIWEYQGNAFEKVSTPADSFLHNSFVFHAARLPHGRIALATHRRGLALLDSTGRVLQVVGRAAGLRSNTVNFIHVDKQSGLWLALNNGLARVETPSPLTYFEETTGLGESINAVVRHRGRFYAATTLGVFILNSDADPFPRFEKIDGIAHTAWCFLSRPDRLLAGTHRGVYEINPARRTPQRSDLTGVTRLVADLNVVNRVFVGQYRGLGLLELLAGEKPRFRKIQGVSGYVLEIVEDTSGQLWVGTRDGLYSLQLDEAQLASSESSIPTTIVRYGPPEGLPDGAVRPVRIHNTLCFVTPVGIYRFDPDSRRFLLDASLTADPVDSLTTIFQLQEDIRGNLWLSGKRGARFLYGNLVPQADGGYQWDGRFSRRLAELGEIYAIYPEPDGVVWFGGAEGLLRYAPGVTKPTQPGFSAIIRSVRAIAADTVFYAGVPTHETSGIEIPYAQHSLRFEYAVPAFDRPQQNEFQVFLEGFDSGWSRWSSESRKEYTALGPGAYAFHVRARDVYGQVSREDAFSFRISPPWFLSWWAYLLYALGAAAGIFAIVRLRVRHLERKTAELEAIIEERTATIREQAEKLQELDKMKSRFFANISHEFRTPLTLILGPLEKRLAQARHKNDREEIGMMRRNAERLLRLINQLLDVSRLESGRMKLQASQGDFVAALRGIVMSFKSLAEQKGIALRFEPCEGFKPSQGFPEIYFDRDKIEKVFYNLLSNAFKFTPQNGTITVAVGSSGGSQAVAVVPTATATEKPVVECLEISVRDSGIGIPPERLPHIFDRFYQVDSSSTRAHEGTGIGLALTKELVELHRGEIEVRSDAGKGSEFIVRLPVGKAHLREDEIVEDEPVTQTDPTDSVREREDAESAPPAAAVKEDTPIILVVDDHPDMRRYLRENLRDDYQVVEAEDGRAGRERAVEVIPDLVISDVMMPELDGYQLCKALKTDERTSHIPVILLTAKAGEEDKLTGLQTGADDYLTKPFSPKELLARSRNLIEQRRTLRQRFVREGMLRPREVAITSVDEAFLQKLMSSIEENLPEEDFGVEALSRQMNLVPRQLHRKVRGVTGHSPSELIRSVRLQRARQLLEQKSGTVSEIAYEVGFSSLSHFAKVFKDQFGKLPSEIADK